VDELLKQLNDLDAAIDTLVAQDQMTDEQKAEHDALVARRADTVAAIRRERDRKGREDERKRLEVEASEAAVREEEQRARELAVQARRERNSEPPAPGQQRFSSPDLPNVVDAGAADRAIAVASRVPANVARHRPVNFRGVRGGRSAEERAYRFGQWCLASLTMQLPGRFRFHSAVDWVSRNMAAVTSKDSSGYQNLIPEEFGQDIIDLRERRGVARRLFKMVPMVSDTRTDPRRTGGLTAYPVGEGSAGTESNKTWDNVRLTAKDIMTLSRYTNQVAADSVISVGDDLAAEIAYAFADFEDRAGFNGDGTSTFAGIIGARTKLDSIDGAGTDSAGLVTQGTGNTWGAIVLGDFHTVAGKLPQYADNNETCWVCHRAFYFGVMQKLELAAGGATQMEVAQGDRRPRPLFLGYPVDFSQVFPGATAVATVSALLGNFMMGASLGDRQQDEVAFSEHATINGENVFERNQIAVRGTERVDINVHDVGNATDPGPIVGLKTGA
jgi:HK97 family phage major capsid protein